MPGIVYHWKHGWIPLDHVAAMQKAKGSHTLAARYLADAHGHDAGIHTRRQVAHATLTFHDVPAQHKPEARAQLVAAAEKVHATELLPGHKAEPATVNVRDASDDELAGRLASTTDAGEIDSILAELDRRDQVQKRQLQASARRAKRDAKREAEYDQRIQAGDDPEAAYEDVYGVSIAKQRQQAAISDLRSQGYQGAGFHELTAAAYRDWVSEQMVAAETGTRGALWQGKTRAVETRNARRLFTDEQYARAHASEELRTWWDSNGGWMSLADFRASILGGHKQQGRHAWY